MSVDGWTTRGAIKVPDARAPLPELDDHDLQPYVYSAVPVDERPHPQTCGRPSTGRGAHTRLGEPICGICRAAEREYWRARRQAKRDAIEAAAAKEERRRVLARAACARSRRRRRLHALVDRFDVDYPEYALQTTRGGGSL